jgi:hypothetical protein
MLIESNCLASAGKLNYKDLKEAGGRLSTATLRKQRGGTRQDAFHIICF